MSPGRSTRRTTRLAPVAAELPDDAVLSVGPVAHGGHCVARHEERVVFVRHTLPGETVRVRFTEAAPSASYWRADAVEVLRASPDRVTSAWPAAGPGGVGGGELSHVALPAQREWKAQVVAEQLRRLAGDARAVQVEPAPGESDGLGWRTRIELVADRRGAAGMLGHRSHEVHPLASMPLAVPELAVLDLFGRRWAPGARLTAVAPSGGDAPLLLVDGLPWTGGAADRRPNARTSVRETAVVAGRRYTWRVAGGGFWQVHRAAPTVLAQAVVDAVGERPGATVLDLYAGAGLFSLPLADLVGPSGRVVAVEGDEVAMRDARRNAHDHRQVELHRGGVLEVLRADVAGRADVVVLDPPRVGAGRQVVEQVAARRPERVVYVACDPAALSRDVSTFAAVGYAMTGLRALDLFPMTHHVECVAVLDRA